MLLPDRNKFYVQKSTNSNCNSTFSVFSAFNTQTVRHVLKTLAIFSVHLRLTHYFFYESIISAILQQFISISRHHPSYVVNTWVVYISKEIFKNTLRTHFLESNYLNPVILLLIYIFHTEYRVGHSDYVTRWKVRLSSSGTIKSVFLSRKNNERLWGGRWKVRRSLLHIHDRLWGPNSLLHKRYKNHFLRQGGLGFEFNVFFHLVAR